MICITLIASGCEAGESKLLSTTASERNATGVPLVDRAELYILNFVMPRNTFNDLHYLLPLLSQLTSITLVSFLRTFSSTERDGALRKTSSPVSLPGPPFYKNRTCGPSTPR